LELRKSNADPSSGSPHDLARAQQIVRLDDKREFIGNAERTCHLEAGTFIRDVSHDAIDPGGEIERYRSGLQDAGPWGGAFLDHDCDNHQ
jgi:hypothetical protein